jgi:hypothetical protein
MPGCQVEVTGKDGRVERLEVEASSLFDAGYQAVERFARLWWWDHSKPITVRRDGAVWQVRPERLSEWKRRQSRPE